MSNTEQKPKPLKKNLTPEQKENASLRRELEELQKMVLSMKQNKSSDLPDGVSQVDIPLNKQIRVMSLCPEKLNLTTENRGKGKRYTFERAWEVRKIPYGDLLMINQNHRNFMEGGKYYILDDRIVEEEGLAEIYATILTKDKMEEILNSGQNALKLFQEANQKQQKILVDMIIRKLIDGETVDFNLVANIDRIMGDKIGDAYVNIQEKVKRSQEAIAGTQK